MRHLLIFLFPVISFAQADTIRIQLEQKAPSIETIDWLNIEIAKIQTSAPEDAELLAKEALSIAQDIEYRQGEAKAIFNLGLSFWHRDLYEQSMENYLLALRLFEELDMLADVARVKMNIGNTYDELGQTAKAKQFIRESLESFQNLGDSSRIITGYLNLGVIFFYEALYDSALINFEMVAAFHRARNDTSGLALIHLNIANVYEYKEELRKAVRNYRIAKELIDPQELLSINIDLGLGNALLLVGESQEGLQLINRALLNAKEAEQYKMEQFAYEALKEYYASVKNYELAFYYQNQEIRLDREWRGKEVQEQIEVLQLKYDDEKKALQLSVLESEKAKDRFYLTLALISGLFILLGAVSMFIILRLRIRNSKLKHEELRQKIEHKNKELASYALNFIQKNELLNELSVKVNDLKKSSSEKTSQELNQLNKVIKGHMKIDQDWENFRLMFEEVHQGFFQRLKERFPDLGNAELKLCALLRLNLNLKESSQILGISSDSVKTARSRLRKKLGLSTEANLVDFVILFDQQREKG